MYGWRGTAQIKQCDDLPNVKPPTKKKPVEDEKETNRRYEKEQRKINFQESWKMGREWLKIEKEEESLRENTMPGPLYLSPELEKERMFLHSVISLTGPI